MAFSPPYDIDPNPMGDTVSEGIEKNDGNIFDIYANLNTLLSMIEAVPATGQQILEALAPVDGIGSGLDAEYLGGRIYSEYGLATHTHDLATQSAPGFMAAIDKQKLDGVQTDAEKNIQSDWNTSDSSHDSFIRNKPKVAKVEGAPEDGFISVFTGPLTVRGASPAEMQGLLDYYMRPEFLSQSAGVPDAGKPVVLDPTGLIHPSMIPAVPAEAIWGAITGTLSNQTDLQDALDLKLDLSGGTLVGNLTLERPTPTIYLSDPAWEVKYRIRQAMNYFQLLADNSDGSGNISIPILIDQTVAGGVVPQLKGEASGWAIAGAQIYTDDYHPAINDLLTEINQLKQRITALEEA